MVPFTTLEGLKIVDGPEGVYYHPELNQIALLLNKQQEGIMSFPDATCVDYSIYDFDNGEHFREETPVKWDEHMVYLGEF